MKRIFTLVLLIAALLFTGCTQKEETQSVAPLKVGMELAYPPFEMSDKDGKPAGVSVDLAYALGKHLGREVIIENIAWDALFPSLKTKKVDIVNYHYKWLESPIIKDEIVLAGKKDIAAMKLSAITGRGTRKDFIDLFFLFQHFTLRQMLEFYNQKYFDGSEFLVLKSLSYFDDADKEIMPNMLVSIDWEHVKNTIKKELNDYMNSSEDCLN